MGMSAHGDEESSIAELRLSEGTGRFSKRVVAALSVGATLLLAPAAFYGGVAYGSHSTMPQSAAMDLVVEKDVIESEPKMQNCASATENCMSNKCCMTSGTKCWRISDTTAKCSKMCPGGNCWVEKPGYAFKPAYMTRDNSIFCYAVHAVKKGHHRREGPRDPLGPAQEQCWPVFLQRLGGLQRPARPAVPDHQYKSCPRQRGVWQVLQERQERSLHQHAH